MSSRWRRRASRRWFLCSRLARYSAPPRSVCGSAIGAAAASAEVDGLPGVAGAAGSRRLAGRLRRVLRLGRGGAHGRAGGARRGRPGRRRAGREVREHAVERAVAQRGGAAGLQAEGLHLVVVAGQHDGVPAGEGRAEPLAELPVDGLGLAGVEPLAVGRVGGDQAVRRCGRGLLEVRRLEGDQLAEAGAVGAGARELDRARVAVAAADGHVRPGGPELLQAGRAPGAGLRDQGLPHARVVAVPAQEAEGRRGPVAPGAAARLGLAVAEAGPRRSVDPRVRGHRRSLGAEQAGRDVRRHEGRLYGQRARPAERVQQAAPGGGQLGPRRVQQQSGGEVLLERRLHLELVGAVAAPVQALAAEVYRDGHASAGEVDVDAHVGRARVHRGPLRRSSPATGRRRRP